MKSTVDETETCNVTSYTVIQTFFHRILRNYQFAIGYSDGGGGGEKGGGGGGKKPVF